MSDWRVAESLLRLREQVNAAYPTRSHADDGTIGDADHASRSSDHNPWVQDHGQGVVTAMDLTHDPRNGFDSYKFADWLIGQGKDPRVKFVISNRRIAGNAEYARRNGVKPWTWNPYRLKNPHDHHVHISVEPTKDRYDDKSDWRLGVIMKPEETAPHVDEFEPLKRGATGDRVETLQKQLGIPVDGQFGPETVQAVRQFQGQRGLVVDGIVGRQTFKALTEKPAEKPAMNPERFTKIKATIFGGKVDAMRERSAYDNHVIGEQEFAVALPARFPGIRPKVKVTVGDKVVVAAIEDVGPWNTHDKYWEKGTRPQAETGRDLDGRKTNGAGIDLSPALARALGIPNGGLVDWEFVT